MMYGTICKGHGANKKRLLIFILPLIFLLLITIYSNRVIGFSNRQEEEAFVLYIVTKGDTLWDIALRYNENMEIRRYIARVKKINGMDTADIIEGDQLKLPVAN